MANWRGCAVSGIALAAAMGWTGAAGAQDAANVEEVVVTASRVQASGFTAPTPTTVLSAEDVQKTAPIQISETLALMPSFRTTTVSSSAAVTANLRAIGAQRTLVLVDGRRHVPTQSDGTMDLNLIPASLVSRTEVVTGGASAAWGSDAVAGVVNLILDTKFEGLKGSLQIGQSKYEDAENWQISLAGGMQFAGGRGRVIVGGEYARDEGIDDLATPSFSRPWAFEERGSVSNAGFATNGLPGVIYSEGVRRADTSLGGLITLGGSLAGREFGPGGALQFFGYGQRFSNNMIGGASNQGESLSPGSDLRYPFTRYAILAHAEYDLTDRITGFAEANFAHSISDGHTNAIRFQGAVTGTASCPAGSNANNTSALGGINVSINHPLLPASVRSAMQAANVTCIQVGKTFREIGDLRFRDGAPLVARGVLGLRGELEGGWTWDSYYQYGYNESQQKRIGNLNLPRFRNALDAVINPANGQVVCRVTLTNASAGCVPLNIFGPNTASADAAAYVTGTSSLENIIRQQVAAANINGQPFKTWAGPVAVAAGLEWRRETLHAKADKDSDANLWQTGNRKSVILPDGSTPKITVKEAYAETIVPIASDIAFADALSLNGAIRFTDYSTSGTVTTWKVGATWDITTEFRLRATRSRDIRAGNLAEVFTATATATANVRNPRTGASGPTLVTTSGNRNLDPEEADTTTIGAVYSPGWASGLRMSLDYYEIKIDGVIGALQPQQVVDRCLLDNIQEFCAFVQTNSSGVITNVSTVQVNLNKFETSGFDFELSYRSDLDRFFAGAPGAISARLLATHVYRLATTAAINSRVTDPSGQFNNPNDAIFGTLDYEIGPFTAGLDIRWYEGGPIDQTLVPGLIGAQGVNIGHVGDTTYTNVSASYAFGPDDRYVAFLRVNNLFNVWPPFPSNGGGIFDEVGRAYRVGLRFKY